MVVTPAEVREQLDVINVQSKQKGEEPVDEARAKDEIENTMLRKKGNSWHGIRHTFSYAVPYIRGGWMS